MIKAKTLFEIVIGERVYQMYCSTDSPLGEVHDALMQMKGYVVDRMISAHKEEHEAAQEQMNM